MSWRIHHFETLGSTNQKARELANAGARSRELVWSDVQSAGVGRRGDHWVSPAGNLYVSLIVRPEVEASLLSTLSLAVGLAVRDAVSMESDGQLLATLKWPNDVMLHDRKMAGILAESQITSDGRVDFVIIGIGINLNLAPDLQSYEATCLSRTLNGRPIEIRAFLDRLLICFDRRYAEWQMSSPSLIEDFTEAMHWRFAPVTLSCGNRNVQGILTGVAPSGMLEIKIDDRVECFATGRLSIQNTREIKP